MYRRALLVAFVCVAVVGAALLAPAGGARPESPALVTLAVDRFFDQRTGIHQFFFSGAISSKTADEYVTVMYARCRQSFSTAVAGAATDQLGRWGASPSIVLVAGAGTYRARWKDDVSTPVVLRPPLDVRAKKLGGGRVRVTVPTYEAAEILTGRIVVLQRLRGGTWSTVQRARLAKDPAGVGWPTYVATFTYRERGAVLRAVIPASSAAPCFKRGASAKWTS
jgi:hypothetical protein